MCTELECGMMTIGDGIINDVGSADELEWCLLMEGDGLINNNRFFS